MSPLLRYTRFTWALLVFVFLVIIAGAVVRTTQSGMGCPDWPTCFGKWIPPTSAEDLPPDFEKYLRKQDIDHTFNVYHTWIESINRYIGAILGILCVIHLIWSYRLFYKTRRSIFYLSLGTLFGTIFAAWLGKLVVEKNLQVGSVTIHMLVALFIAALPVVIITKLKNQQVAVNRSLKISALVVLLMVIAQIILGTEVRSQVDHISKALNYTQRETWLEQLDLDFLIHRSFSWLVLLGCFYLYYQTRKITILRGHHFVVLGAVLLSLFAGLGLYLFDFPSWLQPVHLVSASILAISLFSFRLQMK